MAQAQHGAPHTPEGKPDLTGVWLAGSDPKPAAPVLLPAVAALQKRAPEKPQLASSHCLPGGPLIAQGLYKFIQTPSVLLIVFKDVIGYRQVFLDGRPHPRDPDPSWMGHSIGHWEGDILAVDTIGLNDRGSLQNDPHSEKLHITERYRRRDFGNLTVRIRVEDPETFARPWSLEKGLHLALDQDVLEYVCNDPTK